MASAGRLLLGGMVTALVVGAGCASNQDSDQDSNQDVATSPVAATPSVRSAAPAPTPSETARPKPTEPVEPTAEPNRPSASSSAVRPPDPTAPSSVRPVGRPGATKGPRIAARPSAFDAPLRWADGIEVRVVARQGETGGVGPGSVVGAPKTTFELTLNNGSKADLDVSGVVLTTTYGAKPKRVAQPVYDEGARDFSGKVKPAAATSAVYSFSIPTAQLSEVTLTIDLDARHAPASFVGSLQ